MKHKQFRVNLQKTVAIAGLVLSVISSTAFAAQLSTPPAATVALPATTATPVAPPVTRQKLKQPRSDFF
jgi:hypothetical protein